MKKLLTLIPAILALLATASISAHARSDGPESGGGGGVIFTGARSSEPRLINFYNLNSERQSELRQRYSSAEPSQQVSLERESTASLVTKDPAFTLSERLFSGWFNNVLTRAGNIRVTDMIMTPILWTFKNSQQSYQNHYRPTHLPNKKTIYTAAYYLQTERAEVKVVLSIWNRLPLLDQAGLIIHESLRHYQLGLGQYIDDELLQKATVLMLYCEPNEDTKGSLYHLLGTATPLSKRQQRALFSSTIASCRG